jgi:hypothetical protein
MDAGPPLMTYESRAETGSGRTPVGIILFAASHLLLGAALLLVCFMMYRAVPASARLRPVDWAALAIPLCIGGAMAAGATALLLKGRTAWRMALLAFVVLAMAESAAGAFGLGMAVRQYSAGDETGATIGGVVLGVAVGLFAPCVVVLGYLASPKARTTFALPPGETALFLKWLRPMAAVFFVGSLAAGVMLATSSIWTGN